LKIKEQKILANQENKVQRLLQLRKLVDEQKLKGDQNK
jgi:hypothetical protein